MQINDYKQQNLLMHEVTKRLINTKWNSFGSKCYYFNFVFYCGFIATLTTNIMTSVSLSPQSYPNLYTCSPYFDDNIFANDNTTYIFPDDALHRNSYNYVSRIFIWIFASLRLFAIIVGYEKRFITQIFWKVLAFFRGIPPFLKLFWKSPKKAFIGRKKRNYFYLILKQEWAFYFDITVYILACIISQQGYYNPTLVDGKQLETYLKPCWVWQICAVAITLGWINVLIYMRQMALFGKYIIILNDIIYTFVSFAIIFVIFIFSFTFGFHVLLHSQGESFATFKDAFLKTMIMMSGEFDYGDIFFPEDSSPPYPDLTYAFFIIFFILLSLILLNLLVGLSVSDVSIFVEVADLKKMSMRLKFVLNMERFLNSNLINFFRKKLPVLTRKLFKNKKIGKMDLEKEIEEDDPTSKMWKQVIATNVHEEKENDMKELKLKAELIEKKLKDLEDDAKQDHIKRKEELQETINRFRNSLQETLLEEEKSRQDEIERSIQYMKHLGKILLNENSMYKISLLQILKLMTWQTARLMTHFLPGCHSMRRKRK